MELQRFQDLSLAADAAAFRLQLEWFVGEMGFEKYVASMVYGLDRPGSDVAFVSVSNTPEGFSSCTDVESSRRDPVNAQLRSMSVPFMYDRKVYEKAMAADLWEEQAAFGYRTGIAVAMHMPGNKHFLLGMDREAALKQDGGAATRMLADLQMLAVHAQVSAERLLTGKSADMPMIRLTPREREILQWAMEGKSNWVIGEVLGISANSVKFHLKNAMNKLDSSSRHQAVIKAVNLGLL